MLGDSIFYNATSPEPLPSWLHLWIVPCVSIVIINISNINIMFRRVIKSIGQFNSSIWVKNSIQFISPLILNNHDIICRWLINSSIWSNTFKCWLLSQAVMWFLSLTEMVWFCHIYQSFRSSCHHSRGLIIYCLVMSF